MSGLRESDYLGALGVLREAGDVDGTSPFPEPVLEALRRLLPCDVVAYHEKFEGDAERTIVWSGEPRGAVTPDVHAAGVRYWHQDPMTPAEGARKYSDFFSRREFHRLELYQEVARPVGVEYMMRLWFSPRGDREARLEFDRADQDFGERDRAVFDLLLPHLRQFSRGAARRRRTYRQSSEGVDQLTPRERQILHHVARGKTNAEIAWQLGISAETIRKHLENVYEKLGVHTRTGAVAALFGLDVDIA
ncbi:MAG: hypothetical protein AUG48_04645 [Actinobacteria bacterium 13_1_20CM_3_68_9]|nr:MAG: hypothetical protein AUG48_04645 [Actinobacteria bacterium 13_1_20CM_3_68_9]